MVQGMFNLECNAYFQRILTRVTNFQVQLLDILYANILPFIDILHARYSCCVYKSLNLGKRSTELALTSFAGAEKQTNMPPKRIFSIFPPGPSKLLRLPTQHPARKAPERAKSSVPGIIQVPLTQKKLWYKGWVIP
jgi:hypothetical protein